MSEVVPASNSVLASFIERAARDPDFDVQKFGELLRMQREVEHDQARKAFNRAMASAQAEMLPVVRDAKNTHLNNKYAKLETIDAAIRPIYTNWGFSVRYGSAPAPHEGWMRITCTVAHEAGYFEENHLDAPVTTTGSQGGRMAITPVQAIGSTVTYLRRYLLGMVWNTVLADDDDDGEGTRRAAAAPTPRAARVYEAAPKSTPASNGKPLADYTEEQWNAWLLKLRAATATCQHRKELVEMASPTKMVGKAVAEGPDWVRAEIDKILAESFERLPADPEDDADPDTGEVAIIGEDKVAAG